jgi:FdhD protein
LLCIKLLDNRPFPPYFDNDAEKKTSMRNEVRHFDVSRIRRERVEPATDALVVEEPLEIRLNNIPLAVVMRTPGDDFDLARGFLLTEGIVRGAKSVERRAKNVGGRAKGEGRRVEDEDDHLRVAHARDELGLEIPNVVNCQLPEISEKEISGWQRHIFASSSCGICGRASIQRVRLQAILPDSNWQIQFSILQTLPEKLRAQQTAFASTGGLHAAALFSPSGEIIALREDVGRHNAVDKILGRAMRRRELPLSHFGLLVSGRLSFEIAQKALLGGLPLVAGISAASSLAVELAEETGMTLVGFLRGETAVVYAGPQRIGF